METFNVLENKIITRNKNDKRANEKLKTRYSTYFAQPYSQQILTKNLKRFTRHIAHIQPRYTNEKRHIAHIQSTNNRGVVASLGKLGAVTFGKF